DPSRHECRRQRGDVRADLRSAPRLRVRIEHAYVGIRRADRGEHARALVALRIARRHARGRGRAAGPTRAEPQRETAWRWAMILELLLPVPHRDTERTDHERADAIARPGDHSHPGVVSVSIDNRVLRQHRWIVEDDVARLVSTDRDGARVEP